MPTLAQTQHGMTSYWGTRENNMVNPNTQASVAGILTVTYPITVVSGALAVTGITVPYPGFQGRITLLPTGAFTWTAVAASTGIALAGTAVIGKMLDFVYNPVTARWYPSYIA